jgi:spore coat polysaccharide biosynthesis predicted glycosyltransferase SpsG
VSLSLVLRADGGTGLGIGHVKRCLAIAEGLRHRGGSPLLVLGRADEAVAALARRAEIPLRRLPPGTTLIEEPEALEALALPPGAGILLDISHRETWRQRDAIPTYFAGLAARFPFTGVIDSLLHECLVGHFDLPIELAVIPYVGAEKQTIRSSKAALALGPAYFMLDRAYAPCLETPKAIRSEATRVLITAGGSDPAGLSPLALDALDRLDRRQLDVRVVIGPAFAEEIRDAIKRGAGISRHRVELLEAPAELAEPIAWCDLAVAASGLTKYNLAAMGAPSILLSVDADHAAFHRPFARLGTARHLGVVGEVGTAELTGAIAALLDDREARRAMSEAGRALLDGRGCERLIERIEALCRETTGRG